MAETGLEKALEALEKDKTQRAAKAAQAIGKVLTHYGCRIEPVVTIRGGQVLAQIEIVASGPEPVNGRK